MHLGCVTYNVLKDMDLETIIRTLETAKFEGVELRTTHKHGVEPSLDKAERKKVAERFAGSKVRLLSYGTTCEFQSPKAEERKKQVEIAKSFIELAHDTGAWAVKVRPNGLPKGVDPDIVYKGIGACLKEIGDFGQGMGVEIWMEVHGGITQIPQNSATIMKYANHKNVGVCWNSNATDVIDGSVKSNFELLRPWLKSCHITELVSGYPYRELFALMRKTNYDRFTLCECGESPQPERFLKYYKALWDELNRA